TRERAIRELFVDELHDVIVARRGEAEIRGRPMLCALLSVLVQAGGAPVTPETLYTRAWGVSEYHPLQHRNALYVAINRLRSSLREVLPERDLIERASAGWRLTAGVDACAAVAVRARAKTM
ncbi:MAG TPA: winged helix-turn-helix domain-containing protein, partial [Kofleriaceae bacterium]|nr:winged helix-turn-helix domain-containing protein [Kofleriaceae bacterium]